MFGWFNPATVRASRSNRASRSACDATSARQHLERHVAPEPGVARAVHLAHSARAQRGYDLVGAEARPGSQCHLRGIYRRVRANSCRK